MPKPTPHHPMWANSSLRHCLHRLRKEHGLTQSVASKELGYALSTINAWERGYSAPDFIQLSEWVGYFGMKLAIVTDEEASHRKAVVETYEGEEKCL